MEPGKWREIGRIKGFDSHRATVNIFDEVDSSPGTIVQDAREIAHAVDLTEAPEGKISRLCEAGHVTETLLPHSDGTKCPQRGRIRTPDLT